MSDRFVAMIFSLALLWLAVGILVRMLLWLRARSDVSLVLTPAPTTSLGVVGRVLLELLLFRALWRASALTWMASMAMHYGLLAVLLMHLRFLFEGLPLWLLPLIRFSGLAALIMLCGLLILLVRRIVVDRIRYVSSPSDYLHLLLLIGILISGSLLKRLWPVDLYAVGEFVRGAFVFSWQALPEHTGLLLHIALVLILLFVFPMSKLVHGVGIVFTPTLVQRARRGDSG